MIVAVDFDGVLVEDRFPGIGSADVRMVTAVYNLCQYTNHEVVLWTCRVGERLESAVEWCNSWGLEFTSINSGAPSNLAEYGTDPRKVYADVYIDDKSLGYDRDKAVEFLELLYFLYERRKTQ